jgi:hypothetical protein
MKAIIAIGMLVLSLMLLSACSDEPSVSPVTGSENSTVDADQQPADSDQPSVVEARTHPGIEDRSNLAFDRRLEHDRGAFTLEPKYSYIRSYPGGGGIFIVHFTPGSGFAGRVCLTMQADASLRARLDRSVLTLDSRVAEITIAPGMSADTGIRTVDIVATHAGDTQTVSLQVEVMIWDGTPDEFVVPKLAQLVSWVNAEHPEFGGLPNMGSFIYATYPYILIVEHWTFLNDDWEMRMCFHVMIPPYDWSKLWLRRRGEVEATFACMRESDGTTYEIPTSEYPTFYGY